MEMHCVHQIKRAFPHCAMDIDHAGLLLDADTEKHFNFRPKIERRVPNRKASSEGKHQIDALNKA